jgi:hypothetical protein
VHCRTITRYRVPQELKEENKRIRRLNSVREKRRTRDEEGLTKFIGFDGESITVDGNHLYSLLVVGDRVLKTPKGKEIGVDQALTFLYDYALDYPDRTLVGFFTDYDWTMIFKHLPQSRAESLYTKQGIAKRQRKTDHKHLSPLPVRWRPPGKDYEWEFDTLGGDHRRVKFRKVPACVPYGKARAGFKWAYVLDVFGFWQSSFEKAIDPNAWPQGKWPVDPADYEIIKKGKAQRGQFTEITTEVVEYTKAECRALAAIMRELDRGMLALGIKLRRTQWFGPGQAAQELYKLLGAPTREDFKKLPEDLLEDARASYYGGRFEQFAHGFVPGPIYEYDINSAYPKAISVAPNFAKPSWRFVKLDGELPDEEYALVTGTSYGNPRSFVQALPYRSKKGTICCPDRSRGVYWAHEIRAGIRAGLITRFDAEHAWVFDDDGDRPYAEVAEYYDLRLKVGKNTPEGKAIKLILNSLYGKAAQSIGEPKYSSPILASYITSYCRTAILDAIATHPKGADACIMIATDAVYFTEEHPHLPISSSQLGAWDKTVLRDMYLFMPGLYWEKKSDTDKQKVKTRSIGAKDWSKVLPDAEGYLEKMFSPETSPGDMILMKPITCNLGFSVISPKMALHLGDWKKAGTVPENATKKICAISGNKHKRTILFKVRDKERGFVRSLPIFLNARGWDINSTPYDKDFALSLNRSKYEKRIIENGGALEYAFKDPVIFKEQTTAA